MIKWSIVIVLLLSCQSETRSPVQQTGNDSLQRNAPTGEAFIQAGFRHAEQVQQIQKNVALLSRLPLTDSLVLNNEEFLENTPDGGCSITGYFSNGELFRMDTWIGLSYGIVQQRYFLAKGRLIYVFHTEAYFALDTAGMDHSKIEGVYRSDFYFTGEKLIDQARAGSRRFGDQMDTGNDLLENSRFYVRLLKEKK